MKPLQAADVMQHDIVTVNSDVTIVDAARIMLLNKISGLPVIDWSRHLVGIITEGDLLRRSEIGTERHRSRWIELLIGPGRSAEDYALAHARKVSEVMSDRVIAVAADTPLADIVALMEQNNIKRVPVLAGEQLIGIVSRADLLRALVEAAAKPSVAPEPVSDDRLRELVLRAIDGEKWSPRATINVTIKDGIAELRGCITDERERTALIVLVENVPGVKKVVDQLVWIEPLSGMVLEPKQDEPKPNLGTAAL